MKVGLVLVTYNRPQYLEKCLQSLTNYTWTKRLIEVEILIVDAGSTDSLTLSQIQHFEQKGWATVLRNETRKNISQCLLQGFQHLIDKGCDTLINLDSDAIVKSYWLDDILNLHLKFPDQIVTGFNTLTPNANRTPRRKILEHGNGWDKKDVSGGINYCFSVQTYKDVIEPCLIETVNGGNWDNNACKKIGGIYCTVPSVVQHIGIDSSLGHLNPDVAHDFDPKIDQEGNGQTAFILQYFGIGDIIFTAHIATELQKRGYNVLFPVLPEFVLACQKAYPQFTFLDVNHFQKPPFEIKDDRTVNGTRYIPLRWTYEILKVPYKLCMRSKYDYMGMNWNDWIKTPFKRNEGRETALFEKLGLNDGQPYCLVNRNFKSLMQRKANFAIPQGIKIVEMGKVGDFTLFDWAKVIENASEIHTVSTSIIYLFEQLNLKCKTYIYKRIPEEQSHENYQYLMTRHTDKYIFV